jgi:broad specificity phosphatase PhoE
MSLVLAVRHRPTNVTSALQSVITQSQLQRAHEIAEEIASNLHSRKLRYDHSPKNISLPGCYGANQ